MRKRFIRVILFIVLVLLLSYLVNLYFVEFTGDGKDIPEEALPTDQQYEWIKGANTEKEHRYFFISNGQNFGTSLVTKNIKGWNSEEGATAKVPKNLESNTIKSALSDQKILFGLIKQEGKIYVNINGKPASLIELSNLSEDVLDLYEVKGYSIWYIDLEQLDDNESYSIQVLDQHKKVINELSI
ncbi:hypothetical protein ACIQ34_09410 [Ureibacillus sp. NPDC094379]